MNVTQLADQAARAAWAEEIERAIDNVKRNTESKRLRREWYKAESRGRWSADRKARWEDWRKQQSCGVAQDETGQPKRVSASRPRVWVRGHVPREFLDWLSGQQGSNPEGCEMLAECFFEEWER